MLTPLPWFYQVTFKQLCVSNVSGSSRWFCQSTKQFGEYLNQQHEFVKPLLISSLNKIDLSHGHVHEKKNIRILDIGVGSGKVIEQVLNHLTNNKQNKVIIDGIDKDDQWFDMIYSQFDNQIKNQQLELRLHKLDITNRDAINEWQERNKTKRNFDLITSRYIFQHLGDQTILESTLSMIIENLLNKNGGTMIIQEPTEFVNPIFKLYNNNNDDNGFIAATMEKTHPNLCYFFSSIFPKYFKHRILCAKTADTLKSTIMKLNLETSNNISYKLDIDTQIENNFMPFGGKQGTIGFNCCMQLLSQRIHGSLKHNFVTQKEFDSIINDFSDITNDPRAEIYTETLDSIIVKSKLYSTLKI